MHLVWRVLRSEVISAGSEFLDFLSVKSCVTFPRLDGPVLFQWWLSVAIAGHRGKANAMSAVLNLWGYFGYGTETHSVFWRKQSKGQSTLISLFC